MKALRAVRISPQPTGGRPTSCSFVRSAPPRDITARRTYAASSSRVPFSVKVYDYFKQARHDNPIGFPILLTATTVSLAVLGYLSYDEYFNQSPKFAEYPAGVEQRLRQALHYTYVMPDKALALSYFKDAIQFAEKCRMDPYDKPFIGLRIRHAEMLENFGEMKASVEVLNQLTDDCQEKVTEIDGYKQDETTKELRRRLLKSIIQCKVKASSLYETDYLQDMTKAKQTLSDAVSILVRETQDAQTKGFKDDNAANMSYAEIASILSQMGDLYAVSGEEANAFQVYMLTLQPLRAACKGSRSCKEAQVLSNIASTMDLALKKPNAKINGQPATKASRASARKAVLKWAEQAIGVVSAVPAKNQDSICEMAMISARLTKADLLLEMGENDQARQELKGLVPTLKEKGLMQLVPQVEASLAKAGTG